MVSGDTHSASASPITPMVVASAAIVAEAIALACAHSSVCTGVVITGVVAANIDAPGIAVAPATNPRRARGTQS